MPADIEKCPRCGKHLREDEDGLYCLYDGWRPTRQALPEERRPQLEARMTNKNDRLVAAEEAAGVRTLPVGPINPNEFLTINEVCDRFKIAATTVHKWVHEGKLPIYKAGNTLTRYLMSDLLKLFERQEKKRP